MGTAFIGVLPVCRIRSGATDAPIRDLVPHGYHLDLVVTYREHLSSKFSGEGRISVIPVAGGIMIEETAAGVGVGARNRAARAVSYERKAMPMAVGEG
jgi:hypothetical protein